MLATFSKDVVAVRSCDICHFVPWMSAFFLGLQRNSVFMGPNLTEASQAELASSLVGPNCPTDAQLGGLGLDKSRLTEPILPKAQLAWSLSYLPNFCSHLSLLCHCYPFKFIHNNNY